MIELSICRWDVLLYSGGNIYLFVIVIDTHRKYRQWKWDPLSPIHLQQNQKNMSSKSFPFPVIGTDKSITTDNVSGSMDDDSISNQTSKNDNTADDNTTIMDYSKDGGGPNLTLFSTSTLADPIDELSNKSTTILDDTSTSLVTFDENDTVCGTKAIIPQLSK